MKPHRDLDRDNFNLMDEAETQVLSRSEERSLLLELAECRRQLIEAMKSAECEASQPQEHEITFAEWIKTRNPVLNSRDALGAVHLRYQEIRSKLAMANMRLVAHVAKRFRNRGIAHSDLIQDGFCGLLEAIDRFDDSHNTKLATYATWWIRQSMQQAVASGAYPVKLSPRHLRQLAQVQEFADHGEFADAPDDQNTEQSEVSDLIRRVFTATRPTISLNATYDSESTFSLINTIVQKDELDDSEMKNAVETIARLVSDLRPREQQVLQLRFGLGGRRKLSLSQVGTVLAVSKERVRQIQDKAIERLRASARNERLVDFEYS
jgi:RNA polymerase primary sigma factor